MFHDGNADQWLVKTVEKLKNPVREVWDLERKKREEKKKTFWWKKGKANFWVVARFPLSLYFVSYLKFC